MGTLQVTATVTIEAPAEIVRQQFADVAHHARTGVHRGVRFEVIDDDGETCHYRQTSRVGPLRLRQELCLERHPDQPLVNRVMRGQFTGGTITFDVAALTDTSAEVTARLDAELTGPARLAARLLRFNVRRALTRALGEDRLDIESGRYSDSTLASSSR